LNGNAFFAEGQANTQAIMKSFELLKRVVEKAIEVIVDMIMNGVMHAMAGA
jgi:hypothetical protein